MEDDVTPGDLSRELGWPQKTIRAYLRSLYGKLPAHDNRWRLTVEQQSAVRRRFSKR